jgi:hypothetical protein
MQKINTFSAEADIKHLIENNVVAYLSPVSLEKIDPPKVPEITEAQAKQFDLFYLSTILVTANSKQGNLNDDWFIPEETWAARHTPEDKPFDNDHDHRQIIGHITANHVIADDGTVIDDSTEADKIPDKFHIVTSAVIYKHWKNQDQMEQVAKLIEAIEAGKKYVSMEALFTNFDYAVQQSDGSWSVVKREKATAHMTKHLRCYGGTGEYDGNKVHRVLRNIVFSGKGLVDRPANPESIILESSANFKNIILTGWDFSEKNPENSKTVNTNSQNMVYSNISGWKVGPTNVKWCEVNKTWTTSTITNLTNNKESKMEKTVEALEAQITQLKDQIVKSNVEAKEKQITTLEAKVSEVEKALAEKATKLTEAEQALEAAKDEKKKADDEKKKKEEAWSALNDELNSLKAVQKTQARVAAVEAKGKTHDESVAFVTKFEKVDDETFASIVEALVVPVVPAETKAADLTPVEKVESAKETEEVDLTAAASVDNGSNELISAIASWLSPKTETVKS